MRLATRTMAMAAVVSTGCVGVAPAKAATTISEYSPFNARAELRGGLRASPAFGGACTTGSFLVPSDVAYRCFVGVAIRDPCYLDEKRSNSSRSVVVCADNPWATDVVRLRIAGKLSNAHGVGPGEAPWGLRLASGRRCVRITGVTARVAGRRITYECSGHRWLLGTPNRGRATWSIQQVHEPTDRRPRRVVVAQAWH